MSSPGTFHTAVLHTRDIPVAAQFYNAVFGWTIDGDRFMLRGECAAATHDERDTARWVPYFAAEGVERGTLAVHRDPEGAVFGTCAPDDPRVVTLETGPGSIWWTEVLSNDYAALKDFYRGVFQWTFVETAKFAPHLLYITCMNGEKQAGGILPTGPHWNVDARWQVLFAVEHLETSIADVVAGGGSVEFGPNEVPAAGRFAVVRDPQGALFALAQPNT